ncbi:MAG: glycosyltransferase family 4 protein [Helicobacteraceae bacterium]|nr:glycosyltransferase family 4 protein [Helicobacteraceae bacterium]
MKIAHINLARGFRGGERQTALLIEELNRRGFSQTLVCRADSPLRDLLKSLPNLDFWTANSFLGAHFRAIKADILHAHEAKAARWAYIENRLRKTPYIITRRVPNQPSKSALKTYKKAFCVAAISTAIKRILNDRDPSLKIEIIPSAFTPIEPNAQNANKIREQYAQKIVIGHIGALVDRHKGQSYLIDAARALQSARPDLIFVFLGEGKDRSYLESLAKGLNNVKFLGFRSDVVDYIAAFDLFVFPSNEEGLGSTLLDVMQIGVPIVASNVDGIVDIIIDNQTGVLIAPRDSKAIESAILKYLDDPKRYQILAQNAKKFVKSFDPVIMTDRYLKIYDAALLR